jgi:hypothetical protein
MTRRNVRNLCLPTKGLLSGLAIWTVGRTPDERVHHSSDETDDETGPEFVGSTPRSAGQDGKAGITAGGRSHHFAAWGS